MQTALDRQIPLNKIEDDELAFVNLALKKALPNEFEYIQYDTRTKSINVSISDKVLEFGSLSDGERAIICLFGDIARRICLLNPDLGSDVIEKTDGVVLIDELDVHLHPAWQKKIVSGLISAFPKVQFIVTTHSPQILGEVREGEIFFLKDGQVTVSKPAYGLSSNSILQELMGTKPLTQSVDIYLNKAYEAIDENNFDEAEEFLEKITKELNGRSTLETVQLESLISALRVASGD